MRDIALIAHPPQSFAEFSNIQVAGRLD